VLLEAGWNYGLLEMDFLLWLFTSGLLPWVHLPLHVPLCWECKMQLSLTCYPHIAGETWVKLGNSLLSACDVGWWVVSVLMVCSSVCWNGLCILASSSWFCAALGLVPSRIAEAAAMGRLWRSPLSVATCCFVGALSVSLLGLCLFGWGSLPNVQTV
jgi:hypothetical protein